MVTHRNALQAGYKLHWYEIVSILGQGGFGITYLAEDSNLEQRVAIKEFLPVELAVRDHDSSLHPLSDGHSDTYGWGLNRFLAEAQTLARFRHPNIVRVVSVFETNNTAYMVMEYEQGTSLEDALKFRRVEGEEPLLGLLFPLLEGLSLVHQAGFIHRDIKPDNIYLREDGVPVLLDFGSARQALGVETRTLTTLVSPGFAPFEQYNATRDSDRQGPWTDIYSLGATLYRAVSGKGPPDAIMRANAALEGKPDPLALAVTLGGGGFTTSFLEAIDNALGFLPESRPQTIARWRAMFPQTHPSARTSRPPTQTLSGSVQAATSVEETEDTGADPSRAASLPGRGWLIAAGVLMVILAAGLGGYLLRSAPEAVVEPRSDTPGKVALDTDETVEPVKTGDVETVPDSALDAAEDQLSALKDRLSQLEEERGVGWHRPVRRA